MMEMMENKFISFTSKDGKGWMDKLKENRVTFRCFLIRLIRAKTYCVSSCP